MVEFFDETRLRELHARQVETVRYLDGVFARLFDLLPSNTWVIVTSDHGELFGEERFFGHGPIMHEKVLEVPFVEALCPDGCGLVLGAAANAATHRPTGHRQRRADRGQRSGGQAGERQLAASASAVATGASTA